MREVLVAELCGAGAYVVEVLTHVGDRGSRVTGLERAHDTQVRLSAVLLRASGDRVAEAYEQLPEELDQVVDERFRERLVQRQVEVAIDLLERLTLVFEHRHLLGEARAAVERLVGLHPRDRGHQPDLHRLPRGEDFFETLARLCEPVRKLLDHRPKRELGDEQTIAVLSLDHAEGLQAAGRLAQRRAAHLELLGERRFRWQPVARTEAAFTDEVAEAYLRLPINRLTRHRTDSRPRWRPRSPASAMAAGRRSRPAPTGPTVPTAYADGPRRDRAGSSAP